MPVLWWACRRCEHVFQAEPRPWPRCPKCGGSAYIVELIYVAICWGCGWKHIYPRPREAWAKESVEADAYERHYGKCPKPDIEIITVRLEEETRLLNLLRHIHTITVSCSNCGRRMMRIREDCFVCRKCGIYIIPSEHRSYSTINDVFKQRTPFRGRTNDIMEGFSEILRKNCGFNGLNPVQKKALEEVIKKIEHGETKGIIALPTGTGKTVLAACLLRWLLTRLKSVENARILFLAPSLVILEQVSTLSDMIGGSVSDFCKIFKDLPIELYPMTDEKGQYPKSDRLLACLKFRRPFTVPIIATTPHLISRVKKNESEWKELINHVKILIMDEVHHTYNGKEMAKVMKELIDKVEYAIGLSATPTREAVENVGNLLASCPIEEAMRQGVLVGQINFRIYDTEIKNVEEPCDERKVWRVFIRKRVEEYAKKILEIIDDIKRTVKEDRVPKMAVACPNIREADALSEILKEKLGADDVLKIHYKENERGVLEDFRRRKSGVLVSVNMINIGFNDRNLEALVIARPMRNPISYVQLVGRVLRTPSRDGEEWNIKSRLGWAVVVDLTSSLYRISKTGSPQAFFIIARRVLEGLEARKFEKDLKGYLEPSEKIKEISADVYVHHLESSIVSPEKPEDKHLLEERELEKKLSEILSGKRRRKKVKRLCPNCREPVYPAMREGEMVCPKCGYVFGT